MHLSSGWNFNDCNRLCVANVSQSMKSKLTTSLGIFTFLESKIMLLKQITPVLLLVAAAHAIGAPTPSVSTPSAPAPRYATQLEKFSSDGRIADDAMRLRVSVATDVLSGERNVRIGDVLLCSSSNCYRARTAGYVDVIDTSSGAANVIADVVMPVVKITDVFFTETNSGGVAFTGHLSLKTPLAMDREFYGAELLIGVRKQQLNGKASYIPTQAATSFFNPESSLVHYLPSLQTVAKLPRGAVLTIPAGALAELQVFHVSVNSVGDMYPRIDIYPYLKLNRPAIVEVPPIPGGTSAHEMIVPIGGTPQEQALWATPNPGPARSARVTLSRTGVIETDALEDSALGTPQAAVSGTTSDASSGTTTCAGYLAQPVVIGVLNLGLLKTGAVRVKACEKIKPYVHIVYVSTKDKRIQYSIPHSILTGETGTVHF